MPLFYQPWYLDEVSQEGSWDVALVKRDKSVLGVWPYYLKKKYGRQYCTLPPLTPYLGPLIFYPNNDLKNTSKLGHDKKVLLELSDQLPQTLSFICQGLPTWKNWQALHWADFRQTTRFTYIVDLLRPTSELKNELSDKIRNQISSANKSIEVIKKFDPQAAFDFIKMTFSRQDLGVPFSNKFSNSLLQLLHAKNCVEIYFAKVEGQSVASVTIVKDHKTAYLISTGRSDNATSGAVAALIWKAMLDSKENGLQHFDFEGSMIESIESFFRSFGGTQTPYHRLSRTSNKWTGLLLQALNRI